MGQAWLARDPVSSTWSDFNGRSSRAPSSPCCCLSALSYFPLRKKGKKKRKGNNSPVWPLTLRAIGPFAEPEHFDNLRNCLEPKDFLKRARSLMVVVSTPPTQNYEEFTKKVREYSSKEPFNFVIPELLRKYEKVEDHLQIAVQIPLLWRIDSF